MRQITNTYFTILIIIGGIVFTIILFSQNQLLPTSNDQLVNDKAWILEKNIELIYNLNNEMIDEKYLYNLTDSLYPSINHRLSNGKQIVLFIPENQCGDCITDVYNELKDLPTYIQKNIIVLSKFTTHRNAKILLKSKQIEYPFYNSLQPLFFEELSRNKQLCLFVLDSNLIPSHLFIPVSFLPEMTLSYHKYLISLFENSKKNGVYFDSPAIIELDKNKHDFGLLELNKTVTTEFQIKNIGKTPLIIDRVDASCSCTEVDWTHGTILTNEEGLIKIRFNAKQTGFFVEKILVFGNMENNPLQMIITGKVSDK